MLQPANVPQATLDAVHNALRGLNHGESTERILQKLLKAMLVVAGSEEGAILSRVLSTSPGNHSQSNYSHGNCSQEVLAQQGLVDVSRVLRQFDAAETDDTLAVAPLIQGDCDIGTVVWRRGNPDPTPLAPLLDTCALIIGGMWEHPLAQRAQRAEQSLSSFKKILDNTLDMIFMFDPLSLRFVYLNQGAIDAMGYSEDELLQMRPCDIKPEYPEARFRAMLEPLLTGPQRATMFETIHRRKDGREFPVDVMVQYMPTEGEHGLFVNIVRDLTERRRLDQMKREFVSTVSHELRTPLTSIRGALGLLQAGAAGVLPEKAAQLIEIANGNSGRLVRLINDILDIEKVEAGKMDFDLRHHDLTALVEHALTTNRSYAEQYDVDFQLKDESPHLTVLVDEDRFAQVLANLLSNAAKFSPPHSVVTIAIRRHDESVEISVCDQGVGIPEGLQKRIFQKFVQGDSSDTRVKGGTGLGLSIVKALTERMGGQIAFRSKVGEGSEFTISLPLSEATQTSPRKPSPTDINASDAGHVDMTSPGLPVLIVEDDPDVARMIELMLQQHHFTTETVHSLSAATQRLEKRRYRAVTLDLRLPDGHGLELLPYLRARPESMKTPVVVISAFIDSSRTELQASGIAVENWLPKPISSDALVRSLQHSAHLPNDFPHVLYLEEDAALSNLVRSLLCQPITWDIVSTLDDARERLHQRHYDIVVVDLDQVAGGGRRLLTELQTLKHPPSALVISSGELEAEDLDAVASHLIKADLSTTQLLSTLQHLILQHQEHESV